MQTKNNNILTQLKNGSLMALSFFLTLGILYITYGALTNLPNKVGVGSGLTVSSWNAMVDSLTELDGKTVPSGAIMAFNSDSLCPSGWTLANGTNTIKKVGGGTNTIDLRGVFLRGMEVGTSNGYDSARTLGNYQADAFQGHKHSGIIVNAGPSWQFNTTAGFYSMYGNSGLAVDDGTNGTPRTASETRPKNIAVLYCVKD